MRLIPLKHSVLIVLAACAASISGCVVHTADAVQAGDGLDARLVLTWTVRNSSNVVVDCTTVGADTVRVVADNADTGEVFVDLFDCRAGQGATEWLDAGDYRITVDLAACGANAACPSPAVIASSGAIGLSIFSNGDYDIGDYAFTIQ